MPRQKLTVPTHSLSHAIEIETRKELARLNLPVPVELSAVVQSVVFPELFKTCSEPLRQAVRDCSVNSARVFQEIVAFAVARKKSYLSGKPDQRIRGFLLLWDAIAMHREAGGKLTFVCGLTLPRIMRANYMPRHRALAERMKAGLPFKVHYINSLSDGELADCLTTLWKTAITANNVRIARANLHAALA